MLGRRQPHRGFSIIELVIVMAIVAILLRLAAPMVGKLIKNVQVRTVGETLQNGIRQAQAEAVAESRQTVFVLTNATPAVNAAAATSATTWYSQKQPLLVNELTPTLIANGSTGQVSGTLISGPAGLCFNSVGRMVANAAPGPAGATCTVTAAVYNIANPYSDRPLRVTVSTGGQVRMCDPSKTLSSSTPDGC